MGLLHLKKYAKNKFDKNIIDRMSMDSEVNLNNYVLGVICDLINVLPMDRELKNGAKENLNQCDEESIGEIATYVSLIPYVQLELRENREVAIIANSLVEMLISYIVGYLSREEFSNNLLSIKAILNMSDEFYDELIKYFSYNKDSILKGINENIK